MARFLESDRSECGEVRRGGATHGLRFDMRGKRKAPYIAFYDIVETFTL